MPTTFQKLWEDSQRYKQGRDFWNIDQRVAPEVEHEAAKQMVLRGLELRPEREEGRTFWDDFIDVMSTNSEVASKLLGVSTDVIARWPKTIREILEKVREENNDEDKGKRKRVNMVNTGT